MYINEASGELIDNSNRVPEGSIHREITETFKKGDALKKVSLSDETKITIVSSFPKKNFPLTEKDNTLIKQKYGTISQK